MRFVLAAQGDLPGALAAYRAALAIAERLAAQDPAAFDQEGAFYGRRSMAVGEWLLFFFFHDSYHTGQAEILRQAAGKDDKII